MAVPDARPIFLVGAERSGTTMLRLMLDHHRAIAFFSEFEFAVERVSALGEFPDMGLYRDWLQTNRIFLDSGFCLDRTLGYRELLQSFLEQKRARDGKPLVGATVHTDFDRLIHVWPDARYIYLLRDPRDVAKSTIAMGWAGNVWCAAERWITAQTTWAAFRDLVPKRDRIELSYESLVRDPVAQLTELCRFLGVEYDPRMLDYPSSSSYSTPDPALVDRWRETLSEREIGLVERRVGGLLAESGYAPSGAPTVEVTPALERRLRWQDQIARVRFRIARFGFPLFAAEFLCRKLRLRTLHADIMQRMHEITRQHLR